MKFEFTTARRFALRFVLGSAAVAVLLASSGNVHAQACAPHDTLPPATQNSAATQYRSGGIIADSYNYHRLGPMRSAIEQGGIPQANGWYEYGFPMQSYRWGWFGAERHYPRVIWHDGYYGDYVRTAYRPY